MAGKNSSLRLIGVAGIVALLLTACLSALNTGPSVTPKSQDAICRFGPGSTFASIATLKVGKTAQILGKMSDHTWWEIKDPLVSGLQCWVSDSTVTKSGDLTHVPIATFPHGLITGLAISGPPVIHSDCESDEETNPIAFKITMTTNGPAMVTYHLEVYNAARTFLLDQSPNASLTFASASTQTIKPGNSYTTDCGDFIVKVIVTSPNSMTAQTTWSVVTP